MRRKYGECTYVAERIWTTILKKIYFNSTFLDDFICTYYNFVDDGVGEKWFPTYII